jgi:hypothetical protein
MLKVDMERGSVLLPYPHHGLGSLTVVDEVLAVYGGVVPSLEDPKLGRRRVP